MGNLIDDCRGLSDQSGITIDRIAAVLGGPGLTPDERAALQKVDARRPYGRRVVHAGDTLEIMVATWTRAHPCVPHDHGGSVGGVRVLQGEAIHRIYKVVDDRLTIAHEEVRRAGEVMLCGPDMVHQMVDAGAGEPLMTLHVYAGPIDHMVVYDVPTGSSHVVDGGCGAWIPLDEPELVRCSVPRIVRRPQLLAEEGTRCSPF